MLIAAQYPAEHIHFISDENSEVMFEKRPEAIHLFGTDDLSTDDILEYFSEFSPHHIEWVDDSHCEYN